MSVPKVFPIRINGLTRDLPVVEVNSEKCISIALLDPLGDWELVCAAAKALARRMPEGVDIIVMPEGKAIGLLQALQQETGLPAVVPRKRRTSYMVEPVLEAEATSMTTASHRFWIGGDKAALLKGLRVVILDDVISSGATLIAIEDLIAMAGGTVVGHMAIATEGAERPDVIALCHLPVFIGTPDPA